MSWSIVKVESGPNKGTGIKASLAKVRGAKARLRLAIAPATAAGLGWADGDMVEVLEGEDDHHGMLRLRKNNSVGTAQVKRRAGPHGSVFFHIGIGHRELFVDRSEPARWVKWEPSDSGWIEILLPAWADETSPRPRQRAPLLPAPPAPAQRMIPGPLRNVTSAAMGDPAPGRSALAQRR